MTFLETIQILGWHPDAGVWPLLAVTVAAVVCVLWPVKVDGSSF